MNVIKKLSQKCLVTLNNASEYKNLTKLIYKLANRYNSLKCYLYFMSSNNKKLFFLFLKIFVNYTLITILSNRSFFMNTFDTLIIKTTRYF